MNQSLAPAACPHGVNREQPCIECRMDLSHRRIEQLSAQRGKAAEYERLMHENDIKLFKRMLQAGKRTL